MLTTGGYVIDQLARIADDAQLGTETFVGPFAVIGFDGDAGPSMVGGRSTIRSHAVVYRGTSLGERCHLGHGALVRENTSVGDQVSIGSGTIVEHHVVIHSRVRLHSRCFVPEYSVLMEGAWLGPGVIVTNARFPNRPDTKSNLEGVLVERGAVVGAGAILLPGIVIGEGALVGAGSVVTRDVARGAVVVGNPSRARLRETGHSDG